MSDSENPTQRDDGSASGGGSSSGSDRIYIDLKRESQEAAVEQPWLAGWNGDEASWEMRGELKEDAAKITKLVFEIPVFLEEDNGGELLKEALDGIDKLQSAIPNHRKRQRSESSNESVDTDFEGIVTVLGRSYRIHQSKRLRGSSWATLSNTSSDPKLGEPGASAEPRRFDELTLSEERRNSDLLKESEDGEGSHGDGGSNGDEKSNESEGSDKYQSGDSVADESHKLTELYNLQQIRIRLLFHDNDVEFKNQNFLAESLNYVANALEYATNRQGEENRPLIPIAVKCDLSMSVRIKGKPDDMGVEQIEDKTLLLGLRSKDINKVELCWNTGDFEEILEREEDFGVAHLKQLSEAVKKWARHGGSELVMD